MNKFVNLGVFFVRINSFRFEEFSFRCVGIKSILDFNNTNYVQHSCLFKPFTSRVQVIMNYIFHWNHSPMLFS